MKKQIIYGLHVITNIIEHNPEIIECVYIIKKNFEIEAIIKKTNILKIKCILLENLKTKHLYGFKKNENILCKIKNVFKNDINIIKTLINKKSENIFLILNEIQDCNNLGACIRTAEAANIACVIIIKKKSASITSTIIKVSCGAALLIPIIEVKNLKKIITLMKQNNVIVIGSSINGKKSIYEIKNLCNYVVNIPTYGKCGSLNVSVATGIILFEFKKNIANLNQ